MAADRDPAASGFQLADVRALVSTEDEAAVERLARAERVDGIVSPGTDWPVAVAARVAARIGLPHPLSPETAALAVSKLGQRACLAAAGVPQPRHLVCRTAGEAAAAFAALGGGALVLKPADRQGQTGIGVARSAEAAKAALAVALAASRAGDCLAEELVEGVEVTVNAFSLAGHFVPLTVTDRVTDPALAFGVALAHVWPSALPAAQVAAAVAAARAAAAALGVTDGPTYTQLVVGWDGAPRVIELAARLGGGHDAELCHAALGVDLAALTVAAALGERVAVEAPGAAVTGAAGALGAAVAAGAVPAAGSAPAVRGATTRFLVPAHPGRLVAVEGVEAAAALPGIRRVRVYRQPGAQLGALQRGADRVGAILAVGASRTEAVERAGRAAEAVRFLTSDARADPA